MEVQGKATQMKTMTCVMVMLLLSACGGSVLEDAGGGGDAGAGGSAGTGGAAGTGGGAGTGGVGGTGGVAGTGGIGGTGGVAGNGGSGGSMPEECAVEPGYPGPYQVDFQFVNTGEMPLFLLEECEIQYEITSCANDYQGALAIRGDCTVDCSDTGGGCIVCSACQSLMLRADSNTTPSSRWMGHTYTFSTNAEGCPCHDKFVAPAGKYRIEVPVYTDSEPYASPPIDKVVVDFTLPAPGNVVRVDLTQVWDKG